MAGEKPLPDLEQDANTVYFLTAESYNALLEQLVVQTVLKYL